MLQWNQDQLGQSHLGSRLQVPNQVLRHPSDWTINGLNPNIDGYQRWKLPNLLMTLIFHRLLYVINRICHGRECPARMKKVDPVSKWTGFQRPTNPALCRSSYGGISSDFGMLVVAALGIWLGTSLNCTTFRPLLRVCVLLRERKKGRDHKWVLCLMTWRIFGSVLRLCLLFSDLLNADSIGELRFAFSSLYSWIFLKLIRFKDYFLF